MVVSTPGMESASGLDVEAPRVNPELPSLGHDPAGVGEASAEELEVTYGEVPGRLQVRFPFAVDEDMVAAKFDKAAEQLSLTFSELT